MLFTNCIRKDGFGAQYQTMIASIIYSNVHPQGEYIYSKPDLETVYETEADNLHQIMNLESSFRNIYSLSEEEKNKIQVLDIGHIYNFFEFNIDICLQSNYMNNIRNLYSINNKNQYTGGPDGINVAIHIRRCSTHKNIDIQAHHDGIDIKNSKVELLSTLSNRFLPDSYYLDIIQKIKLDPQYTKPLRFYIFSEGKKEDFEQFAGVKGIKLCLNESVSDTFSNLVHADILVTSPSSFSYVAALLSTGIVYAKTFWHRNASHWISL